ncbi:MASE3 domain-containing protein [Haloplasma contractile]|uniref:Sensory box histidine kinase protein n=1 Tax=Haloplasma contractile SSD-17B TaxID=1033810 RepID=U2FLM8_9MOLU|nr:MASE3 domain-containing protein [Haloplasma contractile]ERJ12089.1 Sensory box histidine kinase protein [Haloplasma contractile SSD-17B]
MGRTLSYKLVIVAIILLGINMLHFYNFLIFHSIVELYCIAVAIAVFTLVWNLRDQINHTFVLVVGVGYLYTGLFDFIHILTFEGMNVIPLTESHFDVDSWLIARYIESISILLAVILQKFKVNVKLDFLISVYLVISIMIFYITFINDHIPNGYISGSGITQFKIMNELIICVFLGLTILILSMNKKLLKKNTLVYTMIALVLTLLSEISFMFFSNKSDWIFILGHNIKVLSYFFTYSAISTVVIMERRIDQDICKHSHWL